MNNRERVLEMVDEGILDARQALLCTLLYMSEQDVVDCFQANDIPLDRSSSSSEDEEENGKRCR